MTPIEQEIEEAIKAQKPDTCGSCAWFHWLVNSRSGLTTGKIDPHDEGYILPSEGHCRRDGRIYPIPSTTACPAYVMHKFLDQL